jgi:hypothetical protein
MKTRQPVTFATHPLMHEYRVFRLGILVLPHLEWHLAQELEKLSEVHVPVANVPIEREYIVNSLRTIRQQIYTTYKALAKMKRLVIASGKEATLQRAITDQLKDSPNREDILARLRVAGGPRQLMEGLLSTLRPQYDRYSTCISKAETYYEADRSETLAEMALVIQRCLSACKERGLDAIAFSVCWNLVSCIVAVVVVVGTIIVTEGETDDENDGENDDDLPSPSPDGGLPI